MKLQDPGVLIVGSSLIALGIILIKSGRQFSTVRIVSGNVHPHSTATTEVVALPVITVGAYLLVKAFRK